MNKTKYTILLLLVMTGSIACRRGEQTTTRPLDKVFSSCYLELHGACYDSVPRQVVSLDLYSNGLGLDSTGRMRGTGTNLYISDIFVDTCALLDGHYQSSTSTDPFTFLPGQDYEGTPHGIYLLQMQDDRLQSYYVLDSGYVDVRMTADSLYHMDILFYRGKQTYKAQFEGRLTTDDKRQATR